MTPLKTPITITIKHVENAVAVALMLRYEFKPDSSSRQEAIKFGMNPDEATSQIESALVAQGIDYRTWEPPAPLKVGPHEVTALDNGGLKVGCTTIDRATIEKLYAASNEGMQGDWPKWFARSGGKEFVFKLDNENRGQILRADGRNGFCNWKLSEMAGQGATQITAAEADAILKGAK